MKHLSLLAFGFCCAFGLAAQSAFQPTGEAAIFSLDQDGLQQILDGAPLEFTQSKSNTVVSLPLPAGGFAEFSVFNSPLTDVKNINSYVVHGPWGGGRIATSPWGVSGVFRGPEGYVVLEVAADGSGDYAVYSYGDYVGNFRDAFGPLSCGYDGAALPDYDGMELAENIGADAGAAFVEKAGNEVRELRVYDLIMTNTGEFARSKFGSDATEDEVVDAFNQAVSALNSIFENELGVRMNLIIVPGLIYLNPATDPYFNADMGRELLGQVAGAFDNNNVTTDVYDLGHLFTAGCDDVGGVASGRACTPGRTRGVTCVRSSVLEAALGIMAHEVAHQFTVSHSWNTCPGSQDQRAGQTAFEPGSGTTIMSYSGICGDQNIGGNNGDYYHIGNLEQFLFYTREGGASACATVIETDNFTPEVDFDYEDGFFIPISTPFRLEGFATDVNEEDILTYNWEQYDLGPSSDLLDPRGDAPLFRSLIPSFAGNVRYFPNLPRIVNNVEGRDEMLPTYSRNLTFRLVARDNNAQAGGVDWKEVAFRSTEDAGPFVVNNPADSEWNVGDYQQVTWNVANTDQAPVNCKRVNIVLSRNGGNDFDLVLAENVVNNGNAFVTVPEGANSTDAYIMVEAADNVFLDVNRNGFDITGAQQAAFTLDAGTRYAEVCLPEILSVDLFSNSILGFDNEIALSIDETSLPEGTVATLSDATLLPGEDGSLEIDFSSVNFTGRVNLTVVAVAEGQDTARRVITLDLIDNDYSDLTTTTPAEGTTGIVLATDFEWTQAANADNYDIQIATSPTFAEETIFLQDENLAGSSFRNDEDFFAPNTLYFWRIRPENSCGDGDWLDPRSFRTVNSQCEDYAQTEATTLPGTGPSFERESTLFIEQQGILNDLNLPNVNVRYNFASTIKLTLVSPAGTEVVLYDENCFGSTNRIDLGFDDDAPVAVACPPDDERVFVPNGSLADFNGENTFGEWILRADISETGGSAGVIESWEIQFCADMAAAAPQLQVNNATEVPPLGRNSIVREKLEVTSESFGSDGIIYTVTALPASGFLTLYGNLLAVGDVFRQDDINGNGLFYTNTDDEATTDDFGYVVTTPEGGYLATDYHDFIITEDAVVSNGNVSVLEDNLTVFPNPTNGDLTVRWTAAVNRNLLLKLYDLNGRLLTQRTVNGRSHNVILNTAELPAGVYLLRLDGTVRRVVKR